MFKWIKRLFRKKPAPYNGPPLPEHVNCRCVIIMDDLADEPEETTDLHRARFKKWIDEALFKQLEEDRKYMVGHNED